MRKLIMLSVLLFSAHSFAKPALTDKAKAYLAKQKAYAAKIQDHKNKMAKFRKAEKTK